MAIKVWRLEHNVSKLGPYYHDEEQKALDYIVNMIDVDTVGVPLIVDQNWSFEFLSGVWGWTTFKSAFNMVKDYKALNELGFYLALYEVDEKDIAFKSIIDDQICFLRS